jgi:hypothetical protein
VKQLLEDWNTLSNLGACVYEEAGGGLNYEGPSNPFSFNALDEKAKRRFKKRFKDLWKSWEALKEVCKDNNYSLYKLYKEFNDSITKVEDTWIAEMKKSGSIYQPDTIGSGDTFHTNVGYNDTPKYYYRIRLHALVFVEASSQRKLGFAIEPQGQSQSMLKWNGSGIVGAKAELESFKTKLEEFLNKEETKKLVQDIQIAVAKKPDVTRDALENFEKQRKEKIKEINSEYRIIEKPISY